MKKLGKNKSIKMFIKENLEEICLISGTIISIYLLFFTPLVEIIISIIF